METFVQTGGRGGQIRRCRRRRREKNCRILIPCQKAFLDLLGPGFDPVMTIKFYLPKFIFDCWDLAFIFCNFMQAYAISTYYDYISRILLDLSKDAFLLIKKVQELFAFWHGIRIRQFFSRILRWHRKRSGIWKRTRYEQRAESIESLSSSLIILLFLRSTWKAIRLITS